MKNKILIVLVAVMVITIILLGSYTFAKQNDVQNINQQYAYQINIHENIDSANPVKAYFYIPSESTTAVMKLVTERYQMYGTTGYVDDINQGNHDHMMLNEITKWNYPKHLGVKVNDKDVIVYLEEQLDTELGLTPYLKPGWNTIEFYSESDGRINASIFVQIK